MGAERVEVRTRPRAPLPAPQQRAVDEFWRARQEEMEATVDFNKDRMLPMAHLKRLIIAEDDGSGMMISADTPAYLAKLCELFVQELAVRAWACAQSHHRRIILDSDIAEAVASTESYDFLATVLLDHQREARLGLGGRAATSPAPPVTAARLITRKRHMPDPDPPRPVHGARRISPRGLPVTPTPPPPDVHPFPFPFPLAATMATATVDGLLMPPINHATTGRALFMDMNGSNNSAAVIVASPPPAGPAGAVALPNVHPAACYLCSHPVSGDAEAFAVGNTDPNAIPPEIVDCGNVGGHRESVVVVPQSGDVQDAAAAGEAGGMFLEAMLVAMDEGMLFPDAAELFPLEPGSEEFTVDQDVLDDVFANPGSSSGSSN